MDLEILISLVVLGKPLHILPSEFPSDALTVGSLQGLPHRLDCSFFQKRGSFIQAARQERTPQSNELSVYFAYRWEDSSLLTACLMLQLIIAYLVAPDHPSSY